MQNNHSADRLDHLLANIGHVHHAYARQQFESLKLYRGQPPVLRVLWDQEGLTQGELAARLDITPATLTKMLQRMEKTGFIYRQNDCHDQRISRVYLTELGRSIQDQLENTLDKMEEETFGTFTADEKAQLRGYMLRIRENLLKATGEEPWD